MNQNETIKKNNEYVWASVFLNRINADHGFDYTAEPVETEKSPIDIYAVSESGKFPALNLQLTYAKEVPFISTGEQQDDDYTMKPTQEAIEHKVQKYTQHHTSMDDIILVVQGYMNEVTAAKVFQDESFKKFLSYPFKGIYYVSPPMISGETDEYLQDGIVVTIKNAFETA